MDKEAVCKALNGREYPLRLDDAFCDILEESGLVVVYGASDDLMEFRGVINDEVECWNGGTAYLDKKGLLVNECGEGDACPHFLEKRVSATTIIAVWCKDNDYSWTYETSIPHVTFDIGEDGEKYCRGIVFKLSDVK